MEYAKFYINTDTIKKYIKDKDNVRDIRIIDADIQSDGTGIDITCLVEHDCEFFANGDDNRRDCERCILGTEWTPCKIKNPDIYDWYLVTCKNLDRTVIRKYNGEWDSMQEVIAWKNLPTVYKSDLRVDKKGE